MIDDDLSADDGSLKVDRDRLRSVLAFPDPVEATAALEPRAGRPLDVEALADVEPDAIGLLAKRIEHLSGRVATLTAFVEGVYDRTSVLEDGPEASGALRSLRVVSQQLDQVNAQVAALGTVVGGVFEHIDRRFAELSARLDDDLQSVRLEVSDVDEAIIELRDKQPTDSPVRVF